MHGCSVQPSTDWFFTAFFQKNLDLDCHKFKSVALPYYVEILARSSRLFQKRVWIVWAPLAKIVLLLPRILKSGLFDMDSAFEIPRGLLQPPCCCVVGSAGSFSGESWPWHPACVPWLRFVSRGACASFSEQRNFLPALWFQGCRYVLSGLGSVLIFLGQKSGKTRSIFSPGSCWLWPQDRTQIPSCPLVALQPQDPTSLPCCLARVTCVVLPGPQESARIPCPILAVCGRICDPGAETSRPLFLQAA